MNKVDKEVAIPASALLAARHSEEPKDKARPPKPSVPAGLPSGKGKDKCPTGGASTKNSRSGGNGKSSGPNKSKPSKQKSKGGKQKDGATLSSLVNEIAKQTGPSADKAKELQMKVLDSQLLEAELKLVRLKQQMNQEDLLTTSVRLDGETDLLKRQLQFEELSQLAERQQTPEYVALQMDKEAMKSEIERLEVEKQLYLLAKEKADRSCSAPSARALELEQLAGEIHYLKEKAKLEQEKCEYVGAESVFTIEPSIFKDNFNDLAEGQACGWSSYLWPANMSQLNRNWIIGTGPGFVDCLQVPEEDVDGYKKSILISEFCPSKAGFNVQASQTITQASSAAVATLLYAKEFKKAAMLLGLAQLAMTWNSWKTWIKKAELRALVEEEVTFKEDWRAQADRTTNHRIADRLLRLRPFVVYTLVDGSIVLSFDPIQSKLTGWTQSSSYLLGMVATDENRRFRDLWISEQMYIETCNRRTITTSAFDKARSVERVLKLLENQDRLCENHSLLLETGTSVYKCTLQFVSALLTRDPHTSPRDF